MKKLFLLFGILFVFMSQVAFPQVKSFRFGLKVSPSISWLSPNTPGYENDGAKLGFNWGLISDFALTENYFLSSGFNINYLNGKLLYETNMSVPGETDLKTGNLSRTYNLRYIDVPLMLKMKTNQFNKSQFYGQIGMLVGFNVKANAKDSFTTGGTTTDFENEISDEIKFLRSSLLLGGGVEYYLDKSTSIIGGISFSNGFTNVLNKNNPITSEKQKAVFNYFELTLGIIF